MSKALVWCATVALVATSALTITPSAAVQAAGPLAIIVDSPTDVAGACPTVGSSATCTVRAAVDLANAHAGSTIRLSALTYQLTSPLTITANGTILIGAAAQTAAKSGRYVIHAGGKQGLIIDADDVTVRGVTITGAAKSNGDGGAVLVKRNADRFLLSSSTITGNTARYGAGLYVASVASAVVEGSTFVSNVADRKGGGIRVDGTLEVINSTFTQNTAQSGGAISVAGTAAISYSTFVDNTSNNQKGGGIDRNGGLVFVTGSILTRANQQSTDGSDCSGNPDLIGPNFVGNAQGCHPGLATLIGTVVGMVGIGQLGDFSGPTFTIPLTNNSIAIDKANAATCRSIGLDGVLDTNDPTVTIDQRRFARPSGVACDLGAFEVTPLQLALSLSASTATPFVGARFLPSSAISQSVIATDALFGGSLAASPLNAFPLESAPLNAFPLNAFPLNTFPLNTFPLNAFFTAAAPLNAFPLNAFPLNAFPLNTFPLSDLVLTEGSWDQILQGSGFEGVPLQSLTLEDVKGVPAVGAIDIRDLNLEGTPLNAFPLSAFWLGSIPLNTFPLNTFGPGVDDWCDLVPDFCAARDPDVDPTDSSFTLASLALAGVPLNTFPLNTFPLNAFPLNAFPLNAFPLNTFPLNTFNWQASPLNTFPLNTFPLNTFDGGAVIDCSKLPGGTCDGATLGDAFAAGAFAAGATLGDLGDLFKLPANANAYLALGEYSTADLIVGLIPSESIPWQEIDFAVPGLQNAADPAEWTFQYFADLTVTAPASQLTVAVSIPPGFAYVPGGARLDGTPAADPVLSCPGGSCTDSTGAATPITLTFALANVAPGDRRLSIDTRAGFELGDFTATANASGKATPTSAPVTAGPSTYNVTVIAPDQAPDAPIFIETNNNCTADGSGDVNLGWVASSTDGIDLYQFDISAAAASCGVRADIFLSNLPADYDVALYGEKSTPLRGEPVESIAYLDDVTLDLNPFDDIVQADTVQDIPQALQAAGVNGADYAVTAISSNRAQHAERIRTGTLRAGTYYIQVTGYNGAEANTPYAMRVRTDGTVARGPCAALPYPGVGGVADITPLPLPIIDASLASDLNTLFITNSQLLEFTYGPTAASEVLAAATAVAGAASSGVRGAILPVDADPAVRAAYEARAADPCDPERSNDVVRAIGDVIDAYTAARPGIEYIVIVGDDHQVPMANIVDDANFANERTFSQDFAGDPDNASNAALAAGRYRSDDPYGTDAGIRIRDHELFVPDRAVGRLVETPTEIVASLDNFVTFGGQLDPDTENRTALQTGYEFLTDGAELNVANLENAGYTVVAADPLIGPLIGPTWTDDDLIAALDVGTGESHLDVIGIHSHFDENNALPAFDNFNPPVQQGDLFSTDDLPSSVDRAVVYSMGCHSGYSVSDIQIGAPAADWAQAVTGLRTNVFAGNTGYGYGDTDRVALTEQLTAIFADEVGQNGSIGHAWADAKQRMLSELLVLDAYQEKALQQFVLYGLPMFHVGSTPPDLSVPPAAFAANASFIVPATPDTDPQTGQPIASVEFRRNLPMGDPSVPQFELVTLPGGSYYQVDGRTLTVNGHPIQPLYAADAPTFDGLEARDALITKLTTVDAPTPFDPVFFSASPNFGGPRPEYSDGSFPAEMATVRPYEVDGVRHERVLIAAGQYRGSDDGPDTGTQRLHTRVVAEVYYSASTDFVAPAIARSSGQFDDDAIQFDVEVDATARRVYVLYRASGSNVWSGVDLVDFGSGSWRGVGPFVPTGANSQAEYIIQAVDDNGNVAMSNSKSRYFLASSPGDVSDLALTASGDLFNGWYRGDVVVTAEGGGDLIEYRVDAGPFVDYTSAITLSDDNSSPGAIVIDTGAHVVTAFDETGAFSALSLNIDSFGPTVAIERSPTSVWSNGPVTVTITADDADGSGVDTIEYSTNGVDFVPYTGPFPFPNPITDGVATVTARATDVAGNQGPIGEAEVRIDTQAPTVTITASPATFWVSGPVTVTVDANDAGGSGIDTVEYSTDGSTYVTYGQPKELTEDGVVTVTARATDIAGNIGVADGADAVIVRIDATPPVVPTLLVASQVVLGQTIAADYSCGDAVSGIATCKLFVAVPGGDFALVNSDAGGGTSISLPSGVLGQYTVRVIATDVAGNSANRDAQYSVVDNTPPVASLTLARTTVEMPATNTATFSCSDAESGVASCVMSVQNSDGTILLTRTGSGIAVPLPVAPLGTYTVTVTATDNGGNAATDTQPYLVRDIVDPDATLTVAKATVMIGQTNTARFTCSDTGSGIASCVVTVTAPGGAVSTLSSGSNDATIPVPVSQAGTYSMRVTATDVAGHTKVATATYAVRLCVVENYDYTQAKQIGSNYTIKIQLCDANGRNISSKNIVLTAVSVTRSDGFVFPPGPNDSGSSNMGYEFRFAQKSYIYNLDTTGLPFAAPGSYTLDFTTQPVPDRNNPPPSLGSARFTMRM